MCRVLSYLGQAILLEELLYKPDNSLVTQSHNPKLMSHILNLAGFGFLHGINAQKTLASHFNTGLIHSRFMIKIYIT